MHLKEQFILSMVLQHSPGRKPGKRFSTEMYLMYQAHIKMTFRITLKKQL